MAMRMQLTVHWLFQLNVKLYKYTNFFSFGTWIWF